MELLAGKMAYSDYTSIIKEVFNEDLAWNRGNINLNLFNYNNKDSEGEYKDNKNPNTLRSTVKWSLSGTPINGWSPTPTLGVLIPLMPLTPSMPLQSSLISSLILSFSASQSPLFMPNMAKKKA